MKTVGMVGTGYWAEAVHAPSIAAADGASFRGIWGRNHADRDRIATAFGVQAFDTYEELLDSVDVVDFAIPPRQQATMAIEAARLGRHLLLEKPMAVSVPDAEALDAAVAAVGVGAVVFLTRLFDPRRSAWLQVQANAGVTVATCDWISAALTPGSPFAGSAWRRASGALWDVGPHILSQLLVALGPVEQVRVESHDPEGMTRLTLRHREGGESVICMTVHADPRDKREAYELRGSGGSSQSPTEPLDFVACHGRALAELLHQAETGARRPDAPYSTRAGVEMTRVLATIETALESGRIGNFVSVDG